MKKVIVLIVALMALCVGMVPALAQSDSITLWVSIDITSTDDTRSVSLAEFIESFQEETGITVNVEQVAWNQLSTRLSIAAQAGGDVPDIVEAGSQHIPSLLDAGALMPLDELLADEPWVSQLTAGDTNACVVDGVRYCVAHNVRGGMNYYHVSDFPDGFPTTPDEVLAYAGNIPEGRTYLNTFFAGRNYGAIEIAWWPLIASNGGNLFDEEGKPAWATQEVADVVEYGRALLAGGLIPEVNITGDFADAEAPWIDGDSSAFGGGSWSAIFAPGLRDAVDAGEVMITGGLSFGGGDPHVFLVSEGWVVPMGAANPEGARSFLSAFMEPEFLSGWAAANFGVPTIETAEGSEMSPFFTQVDAILGEQGLYMQPSPFYVESLDALAIAWQEMLLDPTINALERLQEAADEVLAQYW